MQNLNTAGSRSLWVKTLKDAALHPTDVGPQYTQGLMGMLSLNLPIRRSQHRGFALEGNTATSSVARAHTAYNS